MSSKLPIQCHSCGMIISRSDIKEKLKTMSLAVVLKDELYNICCKSKFVNYYE